MKIRSGYVSNSSSSSFFVPADPCGNVACMKLPPEILEKIQQNYSGWDGEKLDFSSFDTWYLTEMISDGDERYDIVSSMKGAQRYLQGHDAPYGYYDEDGEKNYIVFKNGMESFYVLACHITGAEMGAVPTAIHLRDMAMEIFGDNTLNKTQKLAAIQNIFNF